MKFIRVIIVAYLIYSFLLAEFNPFNWEVEERNEMLTCCVITYAAVIIYDKILKNKEK